MSYRVLARTYRSNTFDEIVGQDAIACTLKNAIDWASRDREEGSLMCKPVTIIGAGGRAGTARAQMQLQETLAETGSLVMVKPGVLVQAFSPPRFDSEGNLTDETTKELIGKHLDEFTKWILRLAQPRQFARYACEMDTSA